MKYEGERVYSHAYNILDFAGKTIFPSATLS